MQCGIEHLNDARGSFRGWKQCQWGEVGRPASSEPSTVLGSCWAINRLSLIGSFEVVLSFYVCGNRALKRLYNLSKTKKGAAPGSLFIEPEPVLSGGCLDP